ncbi:pentatricopeptide repeat-containing protein At4g26680, mitochondrial-like [Neltuma alba]|uniref:pentatricopeptide repeat-containing protein At4g26680, mitochondrial-like n=1 Tax=Neltuma alba TaxID=207710 RepID=UPI0010A57D5E|nr:pentatricopeptide repeat-containing protein At4g26680, mitochondrial-like [Prosopis alba]XP_028797365.1 pentatricopeptide repeat-containing protein At4g26680, mitochondrial-like [Prosopis alba]XP_028797366.1 pentatricopeptide repeat-containing protein At4g26680, mitochondrial-like [Prosopis alba]XP_028797367.1 pentatricopeptide repeat-containing protein At4g26680, mitochondrial-like [Prosopis alba]
MKKISFRQFSALIDPSAGNRISIESSIPHKPNIRVSSPFPIPHRTIPEPKGQDLDFVNVAHSHLINSDWAKLNLLSSGLTGFRVKHVLLKIQRDHVLSLEFFNWVKSHKSDSLTLETYSILVHILTKNHKFKSAESILRNILASNVLDLPSKLFEALLYSYRICDSSPRAFDSLFKTFAHMKKCRNATDTFCRMKEYGFFPTVESCNAYLSSLLKLHRADIVLSFYNAMLRNRISPNVYTVNMVMCAYCKLGKLQEAVEMLETMESRGLSPNIASYNVLISGYCNKGLLVLAMKIKCLMEKNGVQPGVVTFNTLINGFCKEGKLHEANKIFTEMKANNVSPTIVTYNTLIKGYSQIGDIELSSQLYEEMSRNQVKPDILTYNALIWGLCKEGMTKKAAYLVKDLEKENLVPNASTFSALITGQCMKKNSERAFQLYKSMIRSNCHPNEHTFEMLISTFCENEDFDGAIQVMRDMMGRCMTPDSSILSELCCGLCKCGKNKIASILCDDLEARHLLPRGFDKVKIMSTPVENDKQLMLRYQGKKE